jgi:hypothetical protein
MYQYFRSPWRTFLQLVSPELASYILTTYFVLWARYFLLGTQEKVPKEKGAPVFTRNAGDPRSGQAFGIAFLLATFLWRSKET